MKILITGITGFVGSNLVDYFNSDENVSVFGLDILTKEMEGVLRIFNWKQIDILPDVDVIIHLAGIAHDTTNRTKANAYFEINTELTKKIYNWFLQSNANKFIFFSSVKAATDSVKGDILTEDVIAQPIGPYGESKLAAENYILNNLLQAKNVIIIRPCMIHGPGNKGNLNMLYKVVKNGIPWPLGSFVNKRSFCSIDNLLFVMHEIINNKIETGIYQVADDSPLSTNRLIEIIADTIDRKPNILMINKNIIRFIANIGSVLYFPLNRKRLKKLTESYVVSNEKIKTKLGIPYMPISAEDGMKKTLESFKNNY